VSSLLRLSWAILAATAMLTNLAATLSLDRAPGFPLLFLELHEKTLAVGFVAFGLHLALLGYLIWKSSLLPRVIGVLLVVAGLAYVLNSLLVLGFGAPSRIALLLPALPGELSLGLWLLVKGMREIR
jgi:hypothetical protein